MPANHWLCHTLFRSSESLGHTANGTALRSPSGQDRLETRISGEQFLQEVGLVAAPVYIVIRWLLRNRIRHPE